MTELNDFQDDIDAIGRSATIPTLLETALLATGMGFAAVARVTDSRWVTCRALDQISFGLTPGDELEVESTLCHDVRQFNHEIVIDDVAGDPVYVNHHCPARYGFRSYISIPIRRADGSFFGTLCAIDPEPRKLKDDRVLSMFRLFAKMIGEILDADETLANHSLELNQERKLAHVQERFIAILAHDLRNPIGALTAGLRMVERRDIDAKASELVALMKVSVSRMGLLVENLLDHARKRDGGDIVVERSITRDLDQSLSQIIAEFQTVAPDWSFESTINLRAPLNCDSPRICQLFSNLLANAISHGSNDGPIEISATCDENVFSLSVANRGDPIPQDQMETLFLPFERGGDRPSRQGLGLGLFVASEIAKGHGGTLDVVSDRDKTTFTFSMATS